ncbi:hypothetical protein EVAR_28830_1 [Eumeta japonica]|uniref:Uncharacterized protein n=1 Tax=Eumeta variegata TaxID=151549 RepID=A0A4C1WGX7_EUMVA|nr:hypothetical protein EVAR_28830_1 [Eumeta japonica]
MEQNLERVPFALAHPAVGAKRRDGAAFSRQMNRGQTADRPQRVEARRQHGGRLSRKSARARSTRVADGSATGLTHARIDTRTPRRPVPRTAGPELPIKYRDRADLGPVTHGDDVGECAGEKNAIAGAVILYEPVCPRGHATCSRKKYLCVYDYVIGRL